MYKYTYHTKTDTEFRISAFLSVVDQSTGKQSEHKYGKSRWNLIKAK